MKVKNLLPVIFAVFLLPCVFAFAGCDNKDKVTDARITGMKTTFQLGEEFSFGENAIVEKQINNKTWKEVSVSEYSYDAVQSNYNKDIAGTYTIYITIENVEKQPTYTVTVEKGTTNFVAIDPLNATYGQTLADIQLPNGYAWADPTLDVGDVTDSNGRVFNAVYTKNSNYNPVNGQITIIVGKATPAFVAPSEPIVVTWVSTSTKLESITLPAGYEWKNPQDYLGNATDNQGREYDVIYTKSANHNPVEGKVVIVINKAEGVFYSLPNTIDVTYGQTLADIQLPNGYTWVDPTLSVGDVTINSTRNFEVWFAPSENYELALGMASVRVNPAPAQPFVSINAVEAEYGQTLADITLPSGYAWVDDTQSVGDVTATGRAFAATYTPSMNYLPSTGEVSIIVKKGTLYSQTAPQIPSGVTCFLPVGDTPIVAGKVVNSKSQVIEGTYVWENPNAIPQYLTDKNALTLKFIPADSDNYAELTGIQGHFNNLVINPCDINLLPNKLIIIGTAYYTGEELNPLVKLKAKLNGVDLITIGINNYTVSYSNNIDVGYGTVTLTGQDCLTGSISTLFEIKAQLTDYTLTQNYNIELYDEELDSMTEEEAYEYILGDIPVYGIYNKIDEPMEIEFSRYNLQTENYNYLSLYTYDEPQVLYASYQTLNKEFSVTVTIKSTVVESMSVDYSAFQTIYKKTNSSSNVLDYSQIKVLETYASGITKELKYSEESKYGCFTITSNYDSDVVGTYQVVISSYYDSVTTGETATYTFNIEVVQDEPAMTSIASMELANPVFVGCSKNAIYFNIYANYEGEDEPRFYKKLQATSIVSQYNDGFKFVTDMTGTTETTFDATTTSTQYVKFLSRIVDGESLVTFVTSFALIEDYVNELSMLFAGKGYLATVNNETPIEVEVPYSKTGEVGTVQMNAIYYLSGKFAYSSNITEYEVIGLDEVDSTKPNSSYPVQITIGTSTFYYNFVVSDTPVSLNFTLDIEELYQSYDIKKTEAIEGVVVQGSVKNWVISTNVISDSFVLTFNLESNTAYIEGQYWFDNEQTDTFTKDYEANSIKLYWNDANSIVMNVIVKDTRSYDSVIQTIRITKNASPFSTIKFDGKEVAFKDFIAMESVPASAEIEIATELENSVIYLNYIETSIIDMSENTYLDVELRFNDMEVWYKEYQVYYFNQIQMSGQTLDKPTENLTIELGKDKTATWFIFDPVVDLEDLYYYRDGMQPLTKILNIRDITDYEQIQIYYDMGGYIGYWEIMTIEIYPFSHVEGLKYEYVPFIGTQQLVETPMIRADFESFATLNLKTSYAVEVWQGYFSNIAVALKSDFSTYTYEFTLADGTKFDFKKHNEKGDIYLKIYDTNEDLVETIIITYHQYLTPIVGEVYATQINGEWYAETTSKTNVVKCSTTSMTVTNDTQTIAEFTAPSIITHNFTAFFDKGGQTYEIYSSVIVNYSEIFLRDAFNYITFGIINPTYTDYYDEEERYDYFDVDLDRNILNSNYGNILNPYHKLADAVALLNLNENDEYSLTEEYLDYTPVFSVEGKDIKVVLTNSTTQTTKTVIIKMVYIEEIDNNLTLEEVALYGLTGKIKNISILENTISLENMSKIKAIMINAQNEYVKFDLYKVTGEGDLQEDVYMFSNYGSFTGNFAEAGNYKLVITSSDKTATRTINLIIEGEFSPMFEATIGDKTYLFDMDTENFEILGDFKASFDMQNGSIQKLELYLGEPQEELETLDMSIRTCFNDAIYDHAENSITDLENVKLDILTDDEGRQFALLYAVAEGTEIPVYFYLYEKTAPLTITIGNETFAVELTIAGITNNLIGDFLVTEGVAMAFSNYSALCLETTDISADTTINFEQVFDTYNYSILTDIELMENFDFSNQEHIQKLITSENLTHNVEINIIPADVEIGMPAMIILGLVISEIEGLSMPEPTIMPLIIAITG